MREAWTFTDPPVALRAALLDLARWQYCEFRGTRAVVEGQLRDQPDWEQLRDWEQLGG